MAILRVARKGLVYFEYILFLKSIFHDDEDHNDGIRILQACILEALEEYDCYFCCCCFFFTLYSKYGTWFMEMNMSLSQEWHIVKLENEKDEVWGRSEW